MDSWDAFSIHNTFKQYSQEKKSKVILTNNNID